jgi:hypothetical protein
VNREAWFGPGVRMFTNVAIQLTDRLMTIEDTPIAATSKTTGKR